MSGSASQKRGGARQYVTFTLDGEVFGLDVLKVREIVSPVTVIDVLHAPQFIRGVIKLRGDALPVMDPRPHFGMNAPPPSANACVIVVDMIMGGYALRLGILADAVRDIAVLPPESPSLGQETGEWSSTDFFRTWARRLTAS